MSARGEYAPAIPGVYKTLYARRDDAHIGPTYKTRAEARACTAPLDRRINRRSIRKLRRTRYFVDDTGTAIILVSSSAVAVRKGVRPARSAHRSKLSDEQVREIRRRAAQGVPYTELAKCFPVSDAAIGQIARGATYRWVE